MANNVYIGERYVPIFVGDWDSTMSYEPLMIVQYGNNTYTSKRPVPVGTLPTDTDYWALTGNYNGQIISLQNQIDTLDAGVNPIKGAYVTPEFYGAVGDGATDDSAAINDALADGRPVWFNGAKTYKCNSYLTINSNNHLYGNGCKILFDGNATLTPTDDYMLADVTKGVIIDGFNFDITSTSTLAQALSFFNSSNFVIKDCTFSNFYGTCIRVDADQDFEIKSCKFYNITGASGNPGECMFGQIWKNAIVSDCMCDTIDDHFIYMNNKSQNVKVVNCIAKKCGQTTLTNLGAAYQIYASSKHITFDNCSDIDCKKGAFRVAPYGMSGETEPCYITITNHHSINCEENWFSNISNLVNKYHDITISNCKIEGAKKSAIRLEAFENVVISNNIFKLASSNIFPVIEATTSDNIIIESNVLLNDGQYGIIFGNSSVLTSLVTGVQVKNNFIKGATSRGITSRLATNDISISGNIITDGVLLYDGFIKTLGNPPLESYRHSITWGLATDSVAHYTGDIIFNRNPASGQPIAWICTQGDGIGIGTLVSIGNLP